MAAIMTDAFASELLAAAIAAAAGPAGGLNGSKMLLFANPILLSEATVLGDLVEPTFTGYAKSAAMTWTGPVLDEEGNQMVYANLLTFLCTANGAPDTIYGYGIEDGTGAKLLLCESFGSPITPVPNEAIQVAARFGLPTAIEALTG